MALDVIITSWKSFSRVIWFACSPMRCPTTEDKETSCRTTYGQHAFTTSEACCGPIDESVDTRVILGLPGRSFHFKAKVCKHGNCHCHRRGVRCRDRAWNLQSAMNFFSMNLYGAFGKDAPNTPGFMLVCFAKSQLKSRMFSIVLGFRNVKYPFGKSPFYLRF